MKEIFTYPLNPGTQYIDPNYYGDGSSGFYQRIERLRSGNYKAWDGTAPLMSTTAIANMIGRYYEANDVQNGNENISLETLWQYPVHACSMREKMWPVTTYQTGSDNGYAYKMLSNPSVNHALTEGEVIKIRDATIDPGLNTDTPVKYAKLTEVPTNIIIQSYNDTLGYITNDTTGISILGGHTTDVVTTYDAYDKLLKDEGATWIDSVAPLPFVKPALHFFEENFAEANPDDVLGPTYDFGLWGLVMKIHPDVLPGGSSLVTGDKVTFVGDWGRDPSRQLHGIVDNYPYGINYVNGIEIQHHGQIKYEFYVEKIDTYTYHCYEDAGLTHRLHKDTTGRRHYCNQRGLPRFTEYDKIIGHDMKQWYYSNDDTIVQWGSGRQGNYASTTITTTNTDFFLENLTLDTSSFNFLWSVLPNDPNGLRTTQHQYLRANPRGWCYIRLWVDPFNVGESVLRANQSAYYTSPSVNADSNGNTGSRAIGFERDGLDGSGGIYTVNTGQLFFYEFDSATQQFTFYERAFDPNATPGSGTARADTPIASFTTGTLESAPGVLQHDYFRIEFEFAQPIHIQPHVKYAGIISTYLNDYGIMDPISATPDDMRVFRDEDMQGDGTPYYEVDQHYVALYGDQRYYHLSGPGTYTPCARWLPNVWFEPGTSVISKQSDEYLPADSMIELDGNGRLEDLIDSIVTYPYTSAARGKFRTNTERQFWLTSCADTYTDPGPTPLELEEVWDTQDQWTQTGYSQDKRWPTHIAPSNATIRVVQPSSVTISNSGKKYVRSSGFGQYIMDVEYPVMTEAEFAPFFATVQKARGQFIPFYFQLEYDGKHLLYPSTERNDTGIRTLNAYSAGESVMLLQGFPSWLENAFKEGEIMIVGYNGLRRNGEIVTVLNTVDSNVFGEAKIRMSQPLTHSVIAGAYMYTKPYHVVVTIDDDSFEYTQTQQEHYKFKISFHLDTWK